MPTAQIIPLNKEDILALKYLKNENKLYADKDPVYFAKEIIANEQTFKYIIEGIKKANECL